MIVQGAEAIRKCEARLREFMGQAAAAGQYDEVAQLMGWAKTLAALVDAQSGEAAPASLPRVAAAAGRPAEKRVARKGSGRDYPKFSRYRSELIKTGWSKKEKKEYQHRAPWSVVEALCRKAEGWQGRDFVSDELFPLHFEDGTEIPSYQAYLCLAWLKHELIVQQNGRHGYHVPAGTSPLTLAKRCWNGM